VAYGALDDKSKLLDLTVALDIGDKEVFLQEVTLIEAHLADIINDMLMQADTKEE